MLPPPRTRPEAPALLDRRVGEQPILDLPRIDVGTASDDNASAASHQMNASVGVPDPDDARARMSARGEAIRRLARLPVIAPHCPRSADADLPPGLRAEVRAPPDRARRRSSPGQASDRRHPPIRLATGFSSIVLAIVDDAPVEVARPRLGQFSGQDHRHPVVDHGSPGLDEIQASGCIELVLTHDRRTRYRRPEHAGTEPEDVEERGDPDDPVLGREFRCARPLRRPGGSGSGEQARGLSASPSLPR